MFITNIIIRASRRQARVARRNGHFLQEVDNLLNVLIRASDDEADEIKDRLAELEAVVNLQKEPFMQRISSVYDIEGSFFQSYLRALHRRLYNAAFLLMGMMDLRPALFCYTLAQRLHWICPSIPIDERMMCYWSASQVYQMIPRAQAVMEQFSAAIKDAAGLGDDGYRFAFSSLLLSAGLAEMLQGSKINVDRWVSSAWENIKQLSVSLDVPPKDMAGHLSEMLSASPENAFRMQLIHISKSSVESFISYARGDVESARRELAGLDGEDGSDDEGKAFVEYFGEKIAREGGDEWDSGEDAEEDLPARPEAIPNPPDHSSPMEGYLFYLRKSDEYLNNDWQDLAISCLDQMERIASDARSDYFVSACQLKRATIQYYSGDNDEAKEILYKLYTVTESAPSRHSDIGLSPIPYYQGRYLLAILLLDSDPAESIRLLTQAYDRLSSDSDDLLLNRADMLCQRASAFAAVGETSDAEKDLVHALRIIIDDTRARIPYMEKMLKERFWKQLNDYLSVLLGHVGPSSGDELKKMAYEAVLLSKGLLINTEVSLRSAVETESDERIKKAFREMERRDISMRPKDMGKTSGHFGDYSERLALGSELEGVLRKHYGFLWTFPEDIAASLDRDMVLADYYEVRAGEDMARYFNAFVLDGSSRGIDIVPICPVADVEKALDMEDIWQLYHPTEPYGKQLSNLVLTPLLSCRAVTPMKSLAYSPYGVLHRIAIESLPVPDSVSTCDAYFPSVLRLSHARSLASALQEVQPKDIVRIGGLHYGSGNHSLKPLPMADKEVRAIARDCGSALGRGNVSVISDTDGDDVDHGGVDTFKSLSGHAPSILHIATHGFCLSPKEAKETQPLKDYISPMDLSGLYLSGAEEGLEHGTFDNHRGIVTASEISVLDFSATRLVILAACFSGDGYALSDGVFGLQRAFKKAGAGRMILSLWDVDDKALYFFQRMLYSYWLHGDIDAGPVDLRTAFKLAKEDVRNKFPHPQNWAGLIMLD